MENSSIKKDNFYMDAFVLILSNLAMAVLRFVFSIILSNKLGAEGVGLYGLVMPIYDLFTCLVCGGIVSAISKEASSYLGTNSLKNLFKIVRVTFFFLLLWSSANALVLLIGAPFFSSYIIKDSRAIQSLIIVAPALVFIALSSVFKGYFYGVNQVLTPSIIDILEKAVRMVMVLGIISFFSLKDIKSTVAATYLSFTIGEFISFIFLYIFYKKSKRNFSPLKCKEESKVQLLFNILVMAVPLAVNGFLTTAISSISTLMVPRRLLSAGFDYVASLELIGKFSGMALTIVFFPMVIAASISTILIPDISKSMTTKNIEGVEKRVSEVTKMCFILGISTILLCFFIPDSLGKLFYGRNDLGIYIKYASLSAPFIYVGGCSFGILNGLGKQKTILINSIVTSLVQLILMYFLIGIPSINIMGYAFAMLISAVVTVVMNYLEILKTIKININIYEIAIIALGTLFIAIVIRLLIFYIPDNNFVFKNIIIILTSFVLFIFSTIYLKNS